MKFPVFLMVFGSSIINALNLYLNSHDYSVLGVNVAFMSSVFTPSFLSLIAYLLIFRNRPLSAVLWVAGCSSLGSVLNGMTSWVSTFHPTIAHLANQSWFDSSSLPWATGISSILSSSIGLLVGYFLMSEQRRALKNLL